MTSKFTWQLKSLKIPQDWSELRAIILANRQVTNPATYFQPTHPLEITRESLGLDAKQVQQAITVFRHIHQEKSKVVIFGDYDADGICATSILWRLLYDVGFQVIPFIPNRLEHGYGLSIKAAKALIDKDHPDLIITVDNGVVAHEAASWIKNQNIALIISDHHQPEKDKQGKDFLPQAEALLLSTKLCGTSLAWIVGKIVLESLPADLTTKIQEKLTAELDLCALATIADQVPLTSFNRSFAFFGLLELKNTQRPGLLALFTKVGLEPALISETSIGYTLAPRINALGRLAEGIVGVRLLCTKTKKKAEDLAANLNDLNLERQDITQSALEESEKQVISQEDEHILVVYSPDFHEGVIGLVAGRLAEKYFKPVIVMGGAGEVVKGSARSIPDFNITEFLRECKSDLLDVGGHPLAAGFSLEKIKLDIFTAKLFSLAKKTLDQAMLTPKVEADCQLPTQLVSLETAQALKAFAPFGQENREPVFALNNYEVLASQTIGKESRHLKLLIKPQSASTEQENQPLTALFWRHGYQAVDFKVGTKIDLLVKLEINTWRQRENIQLIVLATRDC